MNPLIALQYQAPDLAGAYARGREQYQQGQEAERANALAGYLQQNGAGIMSGDTNALAGLANLDPRTAMAIYAQHQGVENDAARLDLARSSAESEKGDRAARLDILRQQAAQQAAEHAMKMSAAEREETLATMTKMVPAFKSLPDEAAWDAQAKQLAPDLVGQYGKRDELFALSDGLIQGLSGGRDMSDRYRNVGDRLVDLAAPGGPQSVDLGAGAPSWRAATPDEAARYGAVAGQIGPDGKFDPINPPSGMTVESDGQGGFSIAQGAGIGAKPLNEGQSKNVIYATRAEGSLPVLENTADALTSLPDAVAQSVPGGVGRYAQDPRYQQAKQAGDEFLSAILRKDTGAAITSQEMEVYGTTYLPRPGDSPEVLTQKRASRARAVEALRRGMTPAEILALEKENPSDTNAVETPGSPTRYRYNPATDSLEGY